MDCQEPAPICQKYSGCKDSHESVTVFTFLLAIGAVSYLCTQTGNRGTSVAVTDSRRDNPVFLCVRHHNQPPLTPSGMGERGARRQTERFLHAWEYGWHYPGNFMRRGCWNCS